jgi:hypothetical protein
LLRCSHMSSQEGKQRAVQLPLFYLWRRGKYAVILYFKCSYDIILPNLNFQICKNFRKKYVCIH